MQTIVHCGAVSAPEEPALRRAVLEEAATVGGAVETPVDAVETAIGVLESSSRFNAGIGGAVQSDLVVRTYPSIMTDDRDVGAVCSMPGAEHALGVARVVMEETPHEFVPREHAASLADAYGIKTGVNLWCKRTRVRWADLEVIDGGLKAQFE